MDPAPLGSTASLPVPALRPTRPADRDFVRQVYASTRSDELADVVWDPGQREVFLALQLEGQERAYRHAHPDADDAVVEVEGARAGRLRVDRSSGAVCLVDLALLPEFRGAGVGQALVRRIQEEARALGHVVSLHVARDNRAAGLYRRCGFTVVSENEVYLRMEWSPT